MGRIVKRRDSLFSFAVLGDTHINPDRDRSASPWLTNAMANRRAEAVVAQINRLRPVFTVHLGDIVHPFPFTEGYDPAAAEFQRIFAKLEMPLHLVPGNHDVGDKPTPWTPAAHVSTSSIDLYRSYFGDDRYAFDHAGCQFIVVNDQLLNSGFDAEQQQWEWLESVLHNRPRTFVFAHYPPFLQAQDEVEHYDNLAEPARSRLCALLGETVEALFCGHVHNFFYNRIRKTDCYVLPATSAVRHDYSELFAVPPPPDTEFGRDYRTKLGFFLVDVFEDGHVAHFVHSHGETDAVASANSVRRPSTFLTGPGSSPLGVDLRIGWADLHSISFSGAVDEFTRKPVRNDYAVLALWELGIGRLRVPLNDLIDPIYARRIRELAFRGHRFCVFSFDVPSRDLWPTLSNHADHIEAIEVINRSSDLTRTAQSSGELRRQLGVPVFLSKLHVSADASHETGRFAHFIRHGLDVNDAMLAQAIEIVTSNKLDGLCFSINSSDSLSESFCAVDKHISKAGLHALVHVHLTAENPASSAMNQRQSVVRVAEAAMMAWRHEGRCSVFLDTFCDHDRGYFPRIGLVDRFFDVRPAGEVLKALAAWRGGACAPEPEIFGAVEDTPCALLIRSAEAVALAPRLAEGWAHLTCSYRLDTEERVSTEAMASPEGLCIKCSSAPDGTPLLVLFGDRSMALQRDPYAFRTDGPMHSRNA